MNLEYEIFKKYKVDYNKLEEYGFIKENNKYLYDKSILDNSFKVEITIDNNITGKIIDNDFGSEYTSFRIEDHIGSFSSKVREEYINILNDIKEKCYIKEDFIFFQTNRIAKMIKDNLNVVPDFPWDDINGAVFRCENNKWFGLIMNISKDKLIGKDKKEIEIINIKYDDISIINNKSIFKAYHMNKKNWISIILDDSLDDEVVFKLILRSYELVNGKSKSNNEWIMPINSNYFNVFDYIENTKPLYWKATASMKKGDIIYTYITNPYSAILYKLEIISDITIGSFSKYEVEVKVIKKYKEGVFSFKEISKYGVNSVRSTRRITKELSDALNNY